MQLLNSNDSVPYQKLYFAYTSWGWEEIFTSDKLIHGTIFHDTNTNPEEDNKVKDIFS